MRSTGTINDTWLSFIQCAHITRAIKKYVSISCIGIWITISLQYLSTEISKYYIKHSMHKIIDVGKTFSTLENGGGCIFIQSAQ